MSTAVFFANTSQWLEDAVIVSMTMHVASFAISACNAVDQRLLKCTAQTAQVLYRTVSIDELRSDVGAR